MHMGQFGLDTHVSDLNSCCHPGMLWPKTFGTLRDHLDTCASTKPS